MPEHTLSADSHPHLTEGVGLFSSALCLAGRIAQGEYHWSVIERRHFPDEILIESSSCSRRTCDTHSDIKD